MGQGLYFPVPTLARGVNNKQNQATFRIISLLHNYVYFCLMKTVCLITIQKLVGRGTWTKSGSETHKYSAQGSIPVQSVPTEPGVSYS